jgi:hypothetical protein
MGCKCTKICLVSKKQFLLAVDYAFLLGAQKCKASHGDIVLKLNYLYIDAAVAENKPTG